MTPDGNQRTEKNGFHGKEISQDFEACPLKLRFQLNFWMVFINTSVLQVIMQVNVLFSSYRIDLSPFLPSFEVKV